MFHSRPAAALLLLCIATACGPGTGGADPEDLLPPAFSLTTQCKPPDLLAAGTAVEFEDAYPELPPLSRPVQAIWRTGTPAHWYVIEHEGRIRRFDDDAEAGTLATVVDLTDRVLFNNAEMGLVGMAFHPDFDTNGYVYLSYNRTGITTPYSIRIARFTSTDGGLTLNPASEQVILDIDKLFTNHHGGKLGFGADGYLYAGIGDGGDGGDPDDNAQNPEVLLGKFLRIDVDGGTPYTIPDDNPFADEGTNPGDGAPEIYAMGFRNPWQWSFDPETGDLWAGDVGQSTREEIDRVVMGGNYGWRRLEGTRCYPADASCSPGEFVPPVIDYGRERGNSVSGGYVYRGSAVPDLYGQFVFADLSGSLFAIRDADEHPILAVLRPSTGHFIPSLAEGADRELYSLSISDGKLYRIVPGSDAPAPGPVSIRTSRCIDTAPPYAAGNGLFPYDINAPLWSDGAQKQRALFVPAGKAISIGEDGDWQFPAGSIFLKTFLFDSLPVETRILYRNPAGTWQSYSYEWNAEGDDAFLLTDGKTIEISGDRTWTFPSPGQCFRCHTNEAGISLGLETAQLERDVPYFEDLTEDQLELLELRFGADLPELPSGPANYAAIGSSRPNEEKARSYLHANCSHCHRPGTGIASMDLRYETPFDLTGLCNVEPEAGDLGVEDAKLIAPGEPEKSVLLLRMRATDGDRMPPLGIHVEDTAATAVIESWIEALSGCGD